jgi:hypothetical protein
MIFPTFPAKAGIQMQPERKSSPAPLGPSIWTPAFAGEIG